MTSAEWATCQDARRMIEALWERWSVSYEKRDQGWSVHAKAGGAPAEEDFRAFQSALHAYYLQCCRAIWKLLPQEGSRVGVQVAERFLAGHASFEEVHEADYEAEGAAFLFDYRSDQNEVECLVEQARAIPDNEMRQMLHQPEAARAIETCELLKRAAYFVDYAMVYPGLTPCGPPPESYGLFLSADLLRNIVSNPFGE